MYKDAMHSEALGCCGKRSICIRESVGRVTTRLLKKAILEYVKSIGASQDDA